MTVQRRRIHDLAAPAPPDAAHLVLAWYDRHRRALPWRAPPGMASDPYAVWLSEIMLQQTTVAAVKPYFAAFLGRWPTVHSLAAAETEEILRQWAGLGYYSRARNLHACAREIVQGFGGRFPQTEAELRSLPGIGVYTAAAIASIAFGRRAIVVDGNVERVIARLFTIETPLPAAKGLIKEKAGDLTPFERPGDYAQAMMDLGATICSPKNPACGLCPLMALCQARLLGAPEHFPRKAAKPQRPLRSGAVFFIRRADGFVLVRTRPDKGLLGGMTEFPGTEWTSCAHPDAQSWAEQAPVKASVRGLDKGVAHVFTHFRLELAVFIADVAAGVPAPSGCRWVRDADLDQEALPSVMRKVLSAVGAE
jgi:A/G-specific adenine glycosylase